MSAIAAAVVELMAGLERLELDRVHIRCLIAELQEIGTRLERLYPPRPDAQASDPVAPSPTPAGDNGHRRRREPTTDHAEAVVGAMRKTAGPMSRREIVSRTKLSPWQAKEALQLLSKEQVVTVTGATISRRYTLAPDFDVVWDGTRERNGQVPNLLPARSQKAC